MENPLFTMIIFLVSGLTIAAVSQPLIRNKIKPNRYYGFRVPKTLKNEEVWYKANSYSGRALSIAGWITAGSSLLFYPLVRVPHHGFMIYFTVCQVILAASITWAVVLSFRYLNKL